MSAFSWLINFVQSLTKVWTWLSTPLVLDLPITAPIALLSTTALATILVFKLVKVFIS